MGWPGRSRWVLVGLGDLAPISRKGQIHSVYGRAPVVSANNFTHSIEGTMKMTSLVDYILSLFRSEDAARSFVASSGQAMTNAGLVNVSPVEISSAAANALPFLNLGAGDPIGGLQQAVADQYGLRRPRRWAPRRATLLKMRVLSLLKTLPRS